MCSSRRHRRHTVYTTKARGSESKRERREDDDKENRDDCVLSQFSCICILFDEIKVINRWLGRNHRLYLPSHCLLFSSLHDRSRTRGVYIHTVCVFLLELIIIIPMFIQRSRRREQIEDSDCIISSSAALLLLSLLLLVVVVCL